jgi:hypothetical protein
VIKSGDLAALYPKLRFALIYTGYFSGLGAVISSDVLYATDKTTSLLNMTEALTLDHLRLLLLSKK